MLLAAIGLPEAAPGAVADDGAPYAAAHREAHPAPSLPRPPERDEARPLVSIALLEERLDFRGPPEPRAPPKRESARTMALHAPRYTVSRLRPFARRRFSTFRPPCVFIR